MPFLYNYPSSRYNVSMHISPQDDLMPVTPHTLQTLLALALGESNGYELRQQVGVDSLEIVRFNSHGSVYTTLKRLEKGGVVEVSRVAGASGPTGVTRLYQLTDLGRYVLEQEIKRCRRLAELYGQRS